VKTTAANHILRLNAKPTLPCLIASKRICDDGRELVTNLETAIYYPAGSLPHLRAENPDEYPVFGSEFDAPVFEITGDTLKALPWVAKASANNDPRYYLNSVYFDRDEEAIVATDGHRLHLALCDGLSNAIQSAIVPIESIKILEKLVRDQKAKSITVKVGETEKGVWFYVGDTCLYSVQLNTHYPHWPRVVPESPDGMAKAPSDFLGLFKANKTRAKDLVKKSNRITGGKRRVSDALIAFRENGQAQLEDSTIIKQDLPFTEPFGLNVGYMLDAGLPDADYYVSGDSFAYLETEACCAVVMTTRI
jgi:DNA polymerase III sliding clamp (beta) subunit (PCNA family)